MTLKRVTKLNPEESSRFGLSGVEKWNAMH